MNNKSKSNSKAKGNANSKAKGNAKGCKSCSSSAQKAE